LKRPRKNDAYLTNAMVSVHNEGIGMEKKREDEDARVAERNVSCSLTLMQVVLRPAAPLSDVLVQV
jgi:hypothetical protein